MTAYDDYKTLRTAKYNSITTFIADPEPDTDLPNLINRLTAVEDWILNYELGGV